MDVSSWDYVLRQLGLHDPFLDQFVEGMEVHGSVSRGRPPLALSYSARL